jgi:hypothetical protein
MLPIPFASSFVNPAGSAIRELFPYLSQAGIIFALAGTRRPQPDAEGLYSGGQSKASGGGALQYGATENAALREALVCSGYAHAAWCAAHLI